MRPLREALGEDPACDRLLELVDGCGELDRKIYRELLATDVGEKVDDIASRVDRDRSTTYRAVRRLHENGYLEREREAYDDGGYCYRYTAVDPEEVAETLRQRIQQCHAKLESLVEEFQQTYGEDVEPVES